MKCEKCKQAEATRRLAVSTGYDPRNMTWHIEKTVHVCDKCADRAFELALYVYPETKIEDAGTLVTSQS
jgi:protein-arginine kinase activator protein McsA